MNRRGRGYQDFRSKVFRLTVMKIFVGDPFSVSLVSGTKKVLIKGGGVSNLSVETFLSHSAEKIRRVTLWCFTNSMHKKGLSLNSVENPLSHCADKIRRRTLLCLKRNLISKVFKQRKGEASRFCRIFFYFTGPKKLRLGTILCLRKNLVGKNFYGYEGAGVSRFSVEKLLSHSTETKSFEKKPFYFPESFGYRNILCPRVKNHDFR